MFSETVELYDLIYSKLKDYRAEADAVAARLEELKPGLRSILDVGCGTGEHRPAPLCNGLLSRRDRHRSALR